MGTVNHLTVSDDLTIYHALDLKQQLIAALHDSEAIELDLSHVREIDTAGLQVLILLKREASQQHKDVLISACSPAVHQTISFCNLSKFFGDPAVTVEHEQA